VTAAVAAHHLNVCESTVVRLTPSGDITEIRVSASEKLPPNDDLFQ
jgi:hypothetical protein